MPTFPFAFTLDTKRVLEEAETQARAHTHDCIAPLHLLLALLRDPISRADLTRFFGPQFDLDALEKTAEAECSRTKTWGHPATDPIPFTAAGKAALARAIDEAQNRQHPAVHPLHLLLGLFEPPARPRLFRLWQPRESAASRLLHDAGVTLSVLGARFRSGVSH
jgi:ATP-dependent Clp protease ATP-binding subunit ClpA